MKTRRPYALAVIGAEPAGLAAAACAARAGARVAILSAGTDESAGREPATAGIPDFVWRSLDLHESGLRARPVSACISLFEDGRMLATYPSPNRTQTALKRVSAGDHHLWPDFCDELEQLWEEGETMTHCAAANGGRVSANAVLNALASPEGAGAARRLSASTRALLDDYFANDDLKTHIANVALSPFGLGGDEAGSALAVASMSAPAAWRVRASGRGPSLRKALEAAATAAGVDFFGQRLKDIQATEEKTVILAFDDGETLKARCVMAASEAAAARAGLAVAHGLSPLALREGAVAEIRLRFGKTPAAPGGEQDAVFFLADSVASLGAARDAALDGRLPERPPVSFEFGKDEIIVRAPYCPAVLRSEGEMRDWTEQDRQALGRQIVARLAPYLNGSVQSLRRIDVRVTPAGAPRAPASAGAVVAPPPAHDAIGAAARLALDLING